jgi:hypothetical protein
MVQATPTVALPLSPPEKKAVSLAPVSTTNSAPEHTPRIRVPDSLDADPATLSLGKFGTIRDVEYLAGGEQLWRNE